MGVTGELDKGAQTFELWQSRYPGDATPVAGLGGVYSNLGNMEKCLEQARTLMRLDPNSYPVYEILANAYENVNRLDEAEAVLKQAEQHGSPMLMDRYELAFLKGDRAEMTELAAALKKVPGVEDPLFAMLGDTEAWHGRFKAAEALGHQAVDFAQRNNDKETAAFYLAIQSLSRVPAGNQLEARANATAALKLSQGRDVKVISALALAQAGDVATAKTLAAELDKAFPLSTAVQQYWLPTIEAAIALQAEQGQHAVDLLKKSSPLDLGTFATVAYLCPGLCTWRSLSNVGRWASRSEGVPQIYRALRHGKLLYLGRPGAAGTGSRLRTRSSDRSRRSRKSPHRLPELPNSLERCRSRHPDLQTSQGRIRQAAIAIAETTPTLKPRCSC